MVGLSVFQPAAADEIDDRKIASREQSGDSTEDAGIDADKNARISIFDAADDDFGGLFRRCAA